MLAAEKTRGSSARPLPASGCPRACNCAAQHQPDLMSSLPGQNLQHVGCRENERFLCPTPARQRLPSCLQLCCAAPTRSDVKPSWSKPPACWLPRKREVPLPDPCPPAVALVPATVLRSTNPI